MEFEIIIKSLVLVIHSNFFLTLPYDGSCSGMILVKNIKRQSMLSIVIEYTKMRSRPI
ncbi:hypothetical protein ANAPC1_00079 [Anaplasma phagocytophilum]|uniref:Uncharacterized protein n=1 Tax=Anaplasma phagocytophilum TaxID=948 RepID=A0AA45US03_ANAPH|nr:hypothetical protein ANAPC1_00079 [Anaplasma phagocytophilum]